MFQCVANVADDLEQFSAYFTSLYFNVVMTVGVKMSLITSFNVFPIFF